MIAAILATLGVFIFAVLAILVCVYVFSGLGLYTLAKNRGIDYDGLPGFRLPSTGWSVI